MSKVTMTKKEIQALSERLSHSTAYNKYEVEVLLKSYFHEKNKYKMDRAVFREIISNHFGLRDDLLMDRVFRTFDKDNDSFLNMEEFVNGMHILTRASMEQKKSYCFKVYDLNGDGIISREEMFQLLKPTLLKSSGEEDPDEGIKELVEIVLKKLDMDHDSKVSLEDFVSCLDREPLLLECLGPILPDHTHITRFEEKMFGQSC
ncbi:EF-hand calcium-binding domain-containing protein 1 [Lingula anatina]|uniref:EF-hand calcium-binding domain-containing protein 1 n=1 Tax=Lingula anatina TaxID=7574 RepID=A0A1S3I8P1_LINAN|nr:EF-hand calcium-binding domain-containing protein 1 [Lingula anatina]|eukprot:XP_013394630.1 EF-hand calcium-binding domain-containing protein 1 [Lingula anatina]